MKPYKTPKRLLLIALLLICATTTTLHCQTTLYNQYKHRTDIRVACIMQYPITDSVKVDVTLFIPKTKEAVWPLVEEFNLELDKEKVYNRFGKEERYSLYMYIVYKDDIKKRYGEIKSGDDYNNTAILVYNYSTGTIMIFHDIETKERNNMIISFLIETTVNPDILSQYNMNN